MSIKIGDGATIYIGTDSYAYTVIAISKSGKQITLQEDISKLDINFRPNFEPGGFVHHCLNGEDQSYTYERNLKGNKVKATLRKNGKWVLVGCPQNSKNLKLGIRRTFYDYNF